MSLQRLWQRQLAGASGVALFVPVTMLVMLAVLGLTGGFAGLGTLGQLVSGPAAPSPLASVIRASPRRAGRPASAHHPIYAASALGRPRAVPTAGFPVPATPAPSVPSISRRSTGGGVSPPPAAGRRPAPRPGARRPVPSPGSGPVAPAAPPTPLDALVAVGAGVASQIPSPAGATVGQVLRSVGSTADDLLKPGR